MAKYRVLRDTFFKNQFYEEGKLVEFADDVKVSKHFASMDSKEAKIVAEKEAKKAAAQKQQPMTMHELAKQTVTVSEPGVVKDKPEAK